MMNPLGCHANVMWQDQPEPSKNLVKNSLRVSGNPHLTLTRDLLAKLSQEADQLKLHLEQEMTSMQSQLKPYVEEIRETLNSEALRSTLVQGAEELKELKQKLDHIT
uniref:Uncharacterized protein n=1 Tax=Sinocyclocheilus grahami TaxID=75366 RepID=A0A672PM26_SINGR